VSLLGEAEDPADPDTSTQKGVAGTERLRLVGPIWRRAVTGTNHLSTQAGHHPSRPPPPGQAATAP